MITIITSSKNKLIKDIVLLQSKSRERRKQNRIIIEGQKEISLAVDASVKIDKVFFCPIIIDIESVSELLKDDELDLDYYELSKDAYSKISYRESTGGIVVIAETPEKNLKDLNVQEQSIYIILESVEKPGNLGAIARVADGAGVDGIIVCDSRTDIYNPNAIRASLGCVFTNDIVVTEYDDVHEWLEENRIESYAAELTAAEFYHKTDLSGKVALVFGTEATGLTQKWINNANHRIKIPMAGHIDSLNVSTSVAVLVYEAKRQRNFLV